MEGLSVPSAAVTAWLLGGIPFGLVLVRLFKGVDIRTLGSGNVGATNASRAFEGRLRLPVFLLIYVLDFLKGFVPALWFPTWFGIELAVGSWVPVGLGAAAVAVGDAYCAAVTESARQGLRDRYTGGRALVDCVREGR